MTAMPGNAPPTLLDDDPLADDGELDDLELEFELVQAEMEETELLRAVLATFSSPLPTGIYPHADLIEELELEIDFDLDDEPGPWDEPDELFP